MIAQTPDRRDQQTLDLRTQNRVDRVRRVLSRQQTQQTRRQQFLNLFRRSRIQLLQHRTERLRTKTIDRIREMR